MEHLLFATIIALGATAVEAKPLIVAHRGASAYAPENTTPALQLAWDLDADAAEFDVFLTADEKVMLMHDKTTSRTAPGTNLTMKKSQSSDLEKIDVGAWKDKAFEGTLIPTLEEALEFHPEGKIMVIEIKDGPETVAPTKSAIEKTGRPLDDFMIISFNWDTCIEARKLMPDLQVYFLESAPKDEATGERLPFKSDILQRVKEANLSGVDLDRRGVTRELVKECHDMGMEFLVWTVDDDEEVARMTKYGVDAITTNRPDTARRAMEKALE